MAASRQDLPAKAYSAASLAERWGCCAHTIRKMIRKGELKAFVIGTGGGNNHYRISAEEVERVEQCQESPPEHDQDDTADDGAPSGEITPDDLAESLRQLRRGKNARHGSRPPHLTLASGSG